MMELRLLCCASCLEPTVAGARHDCSEVIAALRVRVEMMEKVVNLYSALFRGATPNTDMIIVTSEAYDEINAALAALKEG